MKSLYNLNHSSASIDRMIAEIAIRQHGVFTYEQATLHATKGEIRWRRETGRWELVHPNVYKIAGTTSTWRQQAIAACFAMAPSAVLSHRAAAALRLFAPKERAPVELTTPRNRNNRSIPRVIVHRTTHPIPDEDVSIVDAIPVTRPARTLLDLAAVEDEAVTEKLLDDALRRRRVSLSFLERWLADPRRLRHRGAPVLQGLIAARATHGVTESPLETTLLRLLIDAGLPTPRLQHDVRDGDRFIARLDFAYPDHRVALEADGFGYHDDRHRFDGERARGNELEVLGWRVLRITSHHIEHDTDGVITWIRRVLRAER